MPNDTGNPLGAAPLAKDGANKGPPEVRDEAAPPDAKAAAPPVPKEGHPEYYSRIHVDGTPPQIKYERGKMCLSPPTEYRNLRREIEEVARLVRTLFKGDKERLAKFMETLRLTAESGLSGPSCDPTVGADNLEDAKLDIAEAFPAVRSRIWGWNLGILTGASAICILASCAFYYFKSEWYPDFTSSSAVLPFIILAAFLIPLGVSIGLVIAQLG